VSGLPVIQRSGGSLKNVHDQVGSTDGEVRSHGLTPSRFLSRLIGHNAPSKYAAYTFPRDWLCDVAVPIPTSSTLTQSKLDIEGAHGGFAWSTCKPSYSFLHCRTCLTRQI
jgi:hypothetical protein